MRSLIQFVARLYPKSWRDRYGTEFAALLEDVNPDWRTSMDILKGALEMQMKTWNFGRILAIPGLAGALVAAGVWFATPKQYASEAILKFAGTAERNAEGQAVFALALRTLSQSSLTAMIDVEGLYQNERTRMPIEEVIEKMKKSVNIAPVSRPLTPLAFKVEFAYTDPYKAQRVTQDLASSFIRENARGAQPNLEILDEASLQRKPVFPSRAMIMAPGLGVAGAVALGLVLVLKLRVSRRTA